MKKLVMMMLVTVMMLGAVFGQAFADENRLGVGANYWVTIDDLDSDVDDNGFSWLISYQRRSGIFTIELDGELLPDRFGETAFAPEIYLLVGGAIYAGAGIGIVYSDDSFADEPFFALRVGFDLEFLPGLHLDLSGNYRFNDTCDLKDDDADIDTDTVFLGAALRVEL